ncbi:MAG: hypothetical protein IKU07_01650, partial [Oscillospiraceae bacterium]|nr:hypothetical protein [Oscillospiraceae bacterium]
GLQIHNYSTSACLSDVTITGGTFNGDYAFYTYYGYNNTAAGTNIAINGGVFNGYVYLYNGIAGSDAYPMTVSVTGGTFNSGYYAYCKDSSGANVAIPSITGGTYIYDATDYCVEGYGMHANGDGTYGIHQHAYEGTYTAPTFEADGFTTYVCAICGDSYVEVAEGTKLTAAAQVGEVKYETLAEALTQAKGETVVLLANAELHEVRGNVDLNGFTLKADLYGKLTLKGGTLITPQGYKMLGPDAAYYISTDVVLTMDGPTGDITVHSGKLTLAQSWWTGAGQTLTVEEEASFEIPAGMNLNILSTVIVRGQLVVNGTATLYTAAAKIVAAEGLDVITVAGDKVVYENGAYVAHSHTVKTLEAKNPDCVNTGLTEGKQCETCGDILVAQEEIGATGHSYEASYTAPTYEADGYTTYTCHCGESYVEVDEGTKLQTTVTAGPQDVTAEVGTIAQFSVEASGNIVSYRWEYSRSGNAWFDTKLEGYDTATLSVPVLLSRDGYQYRCVVTDANGKETVSEIATLIVKEPAGLATIVKQPKATHAYDGETAVFTVEATGDGLTYQWQYSRNGSTWYYTGMTGAKTAQLTVDATMARNGYQYRCVVTDEYGTTVTSEAVIMTVTRKTVATSGPEDKAVANGGIAKFTVVAEGEELTYQWQYCRTGSSKWVNTTMTGYNTDTLSVAATTGRNGYKYRCVITDAYGNVTISEEATLTVK